MSDLAKSLEIAKNIITSTPKFFQGILILVVSFDFESSNFVWSVIVADLLHPSCPSIMHINALAYF